MTIASPDAPAPPLLATAEAYLTMKIPLAAPTDLVGPVRAGLVGSHFDSVADVAVCEGDHLVGLVPVERLLAAEPTASLEALMDPDPPAVAPGVDQEVAAWKMVRHGESSLAVVTADGRFLGLVPPQRMLAVLLEEHDEDLARLVGVVHQGDQARVALEEPVGRRLQHRLPWLVVGLLGALVSAGIVGAFEDDVRQRVMIALFLPGVVYLADAVGTQTEALVIRGLSVGVPIARFIAREAITGVLVGVAMASVFALVALPIWGEADIVFAVALALLSACAVATLVALALPTILSSLGTDPAYGSGPLATVIQDLLSIVLYFVIVVGIAG